MEGVMVAVVLLITVMTMMTILTKPIVLSFVILANDTPACFLCELTPCTSRNIAARKIAAHCYLRLTTTVAGSRFSHVHTEEPNLWLEARRSDGTIRVRLQGVAPAAAAPSEEASPPLNLLTIQASVP